MKDMTSFATLDLRASLEIKCAIGSKSYGIRSGESDKLSNSRSQNSNTIRMLASYAKDIENNRIMTNTVRELDKGIDQTITLEHQKHNHNLYQKPSVA